MLGFFGCLTREWGGDSYTFGFGDLGDHKEDTVFDGDVKFFVTRVIPEGDDKELLTCELFPFSNEVKVNVLEGGGGVSVMY